MPGILSIEVYIPKDSPSEVMGCQVQLANHVSLGFLYKPEAAWSRFVIYPLVFQWAPLGRSMPVSRHCFGASLLKQLGCNWYPSTKKKWLLRNRCKSGVMDLLSILFSNRFIYFNILSLL